MFWEASIDSPLCSIFVLITRVAMMQRKFPSIVIFVAISFSVMSSEVFANAQDSRDLRAMKHWTWFQAIVQFNTAHAVECGLRSAQWKKLVDLRANGQIHDAGEFDYLVPRLTPSDRKAWFAYRVEAKSLARKLYNLPCKDFSTLPLLRAYDQSLNGRLIPMAPR